jgi:hypothetical protein
MPNWAEQVTAIATAIGAIGLVSAIGAAIFAARQVEESRIGRQAEVAADFARRWSDADMVQTRQLVASYPTKEALHDAFVGFVAANADEAYIMYRELDYFEQLGALEEFGALSFDVIKALLGYRLVERWELWRPSIDALGGAQVYPMFERLAKKMEATTAGTQKRPVVSPA